MTNHCRICLASELTFKFDSIFDEDGKCAKEIFLLSGLRMMHLITNNDEALICPECAMKLDEAIQLRNLCISSAKYFDHLELLKEEQQNFPDTHSMEDETEYIEEHLNIEEDEGSEYEIIKYDYEGNNEQETENENDYVQFDEVEELNSYDEIIDDRFVEVIEEYYEIPKKTDNIIETIYEYNCSFCTKTFNTQKVLDIHMKTKHDDIKIYSKYQCEICSKVLSAEYELKRHHAIVHEGIHGYKCEFCGRTYGTQGNLTRHLNTVHEVEDKDETINEEQHQKIENVCHLCDRTFKHKSYLQSHLTIFHHKEQRSKCQQCDVYTDTFSDMKKHIREVHESIKNYECPLCSKTFSQKPNLSRHIRAIHTGEKPYECTTCNKVFSEKRNLLIHSWTHTGLKPFKCKYCEKSYRRSHHLQKHVNTIHVSQSLKETKIEQIIEEDVDYLD